MRILVAIGLVLLVQFGWWFADSDHMGYAPLYWLLTFSLGYKMLRMLHEWYHYVRVEEPLPPVTAATAAPRTVDMLTTACPGEPHSMIIRTLEALVAVRYPHTTYLCDEGNDPTLRSACERLGVVHVTRTEKKNAKAGNINNALRQATGEFCVVLDPDHEVTPDFLDQVMPYFEDERVGYVQVVQAYGNQKDSLIARGAAEQTYHFYGPLMMGMNRYNTVQAIGANCTFRRTALDGIGGHAAGLTEDMHTAMRLHAAGWKSVYAPVVVSRGLVPSTLGAFYMQQLKWARGTFDLLLHVYPRLFRQFSWRQRLHYFTLPLYFLSGIVALIDILVPFASLLLLEFPWHLSLPEFALHMLPVTVVGLLIRYNAQQWLREPHEPGLHLAGGFLRIASWWVYSLGLIYTFLNVRVPYVPTPKEGQIKNEWLLSLPNLLLALLCVGAAIYSMQVQGIRGPYTKLMATLALINAFILLMSVMMAQHALLQRLRELVWSTQSVHSFKRWLEARLAAGSNLITRRLRTGSIAFATGLAILHTLTSAGVVLAQWREQAGISDDYIWAHTGFGGLRVGGPNSAVTSPRQPQPTSKAGLLATWTTTAHDSSRLVSLELPAGEPPRVPVAEIEEINQRNGVPVLTWHDAGTGPAHDAFQRQIIRLVAHKNQVLLRPIVAGGTPAAHRIAWQQLVRRYRTASNDTTLVWVWTSPRPDSVASYFPGSANLTWIASDCRAAQAAGPSCYTAFREQVATQIAMQSKPILLFLPPPVKEAPVRYGRQLATRFPEIKAIILSLPLSASKANKVAALARPGAKTR